jgi:hypothetical protein
MYSYRKYGSPVKKNKEKTKGEEPMTNEKNRQEEQDLEISEQAAEGVSGGVSAEQDLGKAAADKVVVAEPKLSDR